LILLAEFGAGFAEADYRFNDADGSGAAQSPTMQADGSVLVLAP
jgi:hypothetical protein